MKDYAKRPQTVQKKQPHHKNGLLFCAFVCAIGAFIFSIYHFHHAFALTQKTAQSQAIPLAFAKPAEKIAHKTPVKKIVRNTAKPAPKELPPIADNQPKYDFYKLLPRMTVVIPADNDNQK